MGRLVGPAGKWALLSAWVHAGWNLRRTTAKSVASSRLPVRCAVYHCASPPGSADGRTYLERWRRRGWRCGGGGGGGGGDVEAVAEAEAVAMAVAGVAKVGGGAGEGGGGEVVKEVEGEGGVVRREGRDEREPRRQREQQQRRARRANGAQPQHEAAEEDVEEEPVRHHRRQKPAVELHGALGKPRQPRLCVRQSKEALTSVGSV